MRGSDRWVAEHGGADAEDMVSWGATGRLDVHFAGAIYNLVRIARCRQWHEY